MRIIIHEVVGGPMALAEYAGKRWNLKRSDAIDAALAAGDGDYSIQEWYAEGESYAACVLAALATAMRRGGALPVTVRGGEATFPTTVTRTVRRSEAK